MTYHHGELRAALIKSATQLIRSTETSGASDWSMRKIAREAGVSQAAPYRHFENKEALEAAVADEVFVDVERRYVEALLSVKSVDGTRSEPEIERALGGAYLQYAFDEPALFRMVFTSDRFLSSPAAMSSYLVFRGSLGEERCDVIWAAAHGVASLVLSGGFSRSYGKAMAGKMLDALTCAGESSLATERPSELELISQRELISQHDPSELADD